VLWGSFPLWDVGWSSEPFFSYFLETWTLSELLVFSHTVLYGHVQKGWKLGMAQKMLVQELLIKLLAPVLSSERPVS
jgi:hypothetical protein